jgi:hypothetical protein
MAVTVSVGQIVLGFIVAFAAYSFFKGAPEPEFTRGDPMFTQRFPASGKLKLKNSYISDMPFHIYDADGTGISG